MKSFSVSVIIPAYNCQKTIESLLLALEKQTHPIDEIIVVDDGSTDDTVSIVKSFANVKLIVQKNAGPATARNTGAGESKCDVLFFTDSDCIPHSNWIEMMLPHFENENVGAVAGSYGIANPHSLLAQGVHQEILFRHHQLMPDYPKAFGSYNVAIRRLVFESVGGFNAFYRRASGEDNDLSYKIIAAGNKIYFERNALVDHFHPVSVRKYLREQFQHGFWRAKMYVDHPKMIKGDDYTFWKDLVEMPWVFFCVSLAFMTFFSLGWGSVLAFLVIGFLLFELIFSVYFTKSFILGVFFGLIMFFRAFLRFIGIVFGLLMLSKKA